MSPSVAAMMAQTPTMVRVHGSPLDLSQPAALDRALDQMMAFIDGSLLRHTLAVDYEPMNGATVLQLTPYEFGEVSDRATLRREMLKAMDIYRMAFN